MSLAVALIVAGPAWARQAPRESTAREAKGGPVVRTFGAEGSYRTEVTSQTRGVLSQDDRRQVSLLAAQAFQHVDKARRALDADETKQARQEVEAGRRAIAAIRALLPRTSVQTRTTAPDGKVIYEDDREVQEDHVPLYEGMLHVKTLAPIVAAKRNAAEVAGVKLLESALISTEVTVDLDVLEAQLKRAARALDDTEIRDAARALTLAQVRGVDFSYHKDEASLADARDALWLTRRTLEENNPTQA